MGEFTYRTHTAPPRQYAVVTGLSSDGSEILLTIRSERVVVGGGQSRCFES